MVTLRNKDGKPFSKWKPAEKFEHIFNSSYPDLFKFCEKEFQFDDERKWRFDYAWTELKVAVEVDGFGYGHQAQQMIAGQNEKRNTAISRGWRIFVLDSRSLGSLKGVQENADLVAEFLCGMN